MRNFLFGAVKICLSLACASLVFLLFCTAIVASRNYMGICRDTGVRLDDRRKIDLAVKQTMKDYYSNKAGAYSITMDEDLVRRINPIKYSGLSDFYRENKDCCRFVKGNGGNYEWMPPGLFEKFTGEVSAVIEVRFLLFYSDIDGLKKSKKITSFVTVSNCGLTNKVN